MHKMFKYFACQTHKLSRHLIVCHVSATKCDDPAFNTLAFGSWNSIQNILKILSPPVLIYAISQLTVSLLFLTPFDGVQNGWVLRCGHTGALYEFPFSKFPIRRKSISLKLMELHRLLLRYTGVPATSKDRLLQQTQNWSDSQCARN